MLSSEHTHLQLEVCSFLKLISLRISIKCTRIHLCGFNITVLFDYLKTLNMDFVLT